MHSICFDEIQNIENENNIWKIPDKLLFLNSY